MPSARKKRGNPWVVPLLTALAAVLPVAALGFVALHVASEALREGARLAVDTSRKITEETHDHLLHWRMAQLDRSITLRAERLDRSIGRVLALGRSLGKEVGRNLARGDWSPCLPGEEPRPFTGYLSTRGTLRVRGFAVLRGTGRVKGQLVGLVAGRISGRIRGRLRGPVSLQLRGRLDGVETDGRLDGTVDHRIDGLVEGVLSSETTTAGAGVHRASLEGEVDAELDGLLSNAVEAELEGSWSGTVQGQVGGRFSGSENRTWAHLAEVLAFVQDSSDVVTAAYLADEAGHGLFSDTAGPDRKVPADFDVLRRHWFRSALGRKGTEPWVTRPYVDVLGNGLCFTVVTRAEDEAQKLVATAGIDVQVAHLQEIVKGSAPGTLAMLVARDGRILLRESYSEPSAPLPQFAEATLAKNCPSHLAPSIEALLHSGKGLLACEAPGRKLLLRFHPLRYLPWRLVLLVDLALLTRPIDEAARRVTAATHHRRDLSLHRQRETQLRLLWALGFFGIFATVMAMILYRSRRSAEEARRESEERNRLLIDFSHDGILLLDGGSLQFANRQARHLLAPMAEGSLVGLPLERLFPKGSEEAVMAGIRSASETGEPFRELDGTMLRLDGLPFPAEWVALPIPLGKERTMLFEFRELSDRRLFETRLVQNQKMESLGVLAGGIAHDFNNLLTGVIGNAALLLMDMDEGNPSHAPLCQIERTARRASELVKQILGYAGKRSLYVSPVKLTEVIREVAELLRVPLGKETQLRLELADELPSIEADAAQVQQAVLQLVTNAAEALGVEPGFVELRCERVELSPEACRSFSGPLPPRIGPNVRIEVSDDGPGLPAHSEERIFDPFFTTKFMGRGLGLATVLGIMRGHGGSIDVRRHDGITTFALHFPVPEEPSSSS